MCGIETTCSALEVALDEQLNSRLLSWETRLAASLQPRTAVVSAGHSTVAVRLPV